MKYLKFCNLFIFIFLFFVNISFSIEIYVDIPIFKPVIKKLYPDVVFKEKNECEIGFYNGLKEIEKRDNFYDYTYGIDNLIYTKGKKVNWYVYTSFSGYKKCIKNIARILSLNFPKKSEMIESNLKKIILHIEKIEEGIKRKKTVCFKNGDRFDYLLNDLGIHFINVDKYFVYKEPAYRYLHLKKVYFFNPPDDFLKKQLQSRGYEIVEINIKDDEEWPIYLKRIAEVIING